MDYYLYAIGFENDLINKEYDNCYIGVTNNPKKRFENHSKSGYTVCQHIQLYEWTYEKNMLILYNGNEQECFLLEEKYRPLPLMGLNEATGGKGGYTSYSKQRNEKVSKALKGRNIFWNEKISKTRKEKGISSGTKNPMAKKWKFIDPFGNEYIVDGNYHQFCEEHNLSHAALRRILGNQLGEISPKFRDHGNQSSRDRRINSTGWTLFEEK